MKLKILTSFSILLFAFSIFLAIPQSADAARTCCISGNTCTTDAQCTGEGDSCGGLCNPLGSADMSLIDFWIRLVQLLLGALGLFAVMMFIYGGFIMLTSGGNQEKIKKAKDTLVWAIFGLATIIGSGAVVGFLFENFNF